MKKCGAIRQRQPLPDRASTLDGPNRKLHGGRAAGCGLADGASGCRGAIAVSAAHKLELLLEA